MRPLYRFIPNLALTLLLTASGAVAQLDSYGGNTAKPISSGFVAGSATGCGGPCFRTAKVGNRWWLVTPLGNAYWMQAVQNTASGQASGVIGTGKKYATTAQWLQSRNDRLRAWGFNALGEYTSGSAGGTNPHPYLLILTTGQDLELNGSVVNWVTLGCTDPPKEIVAGLASAANVSLDPGKQIIDFYDACWPLAVKAEYNYFKTTYYPGLITDPMVIGITTDDADAVYGFKTGSGDDPANFKPSPNAGFMIAFARPHYLPSYNVIGGGGGAAWNNTTLQAKAQWISYLKSKYSNSISALNSAWGTSGFYTTFDSTVVTISNQVLYNVGYRKLQNPFAGWERVNDTNGSGDPAQGTGACAGQGGTGSCVGIWFHYYGPTGTGCTAASALTVGASLTASNTIGQFPATPSNANGTFTVTQTGLTYPCSLKVAQAANTFDSANNEPSAIIAFTESITSFTFNLLNVPLVAGSVTISVPGGVTATDDGAGHLTGTGVAAGSVINYSTGAITLNLSVAPPQGDITATYNGDGYGLGTGVNDENGQHTGWVGTPLTGSFLDSTASAGMLADVNGFLKQFAAQYVSSTVGAIRTIDANHLIFGPDALNNFGIAMRDSQAQGLCAAVWPNGIDVIELNYNTSSATASMAGDNHTYSVCGKPAVSWYAIISTDSDEAGTDGNFNWTTQEARGAHFRDYDVPNLLNAYNAGAFYMVGLDWWSWFNTNSTNYGLASNLDNSWNGVEDVIASVPCSTPPGATFTCGGEAANHGNFVTAATTGLSLWLNPPTATGSSVSGTIKGTIQ